MFSYKNYMLVFTCIFEVNHFIYVFVCTYITIFCLFVRHLVPPCEFSEGIVCLSVSASFSVYLPSFFSLTFHLHWEIGLCHHIFSNDKPFAFLWFLYSQHKSNSCRWLGVILLVLRCFITFVSLSVLLEDIYFTPWWSATNLQTKLYHFDA